MCQSDCLTQEINEEMSSGLVAMWFMLRSHMHSFIAAGHQVAVLVVAGRHLLKLLVAS